MKTKTTKTSKGFFFVLIVFISILYIFIYFTAWINAVEISEKVSSEKFRALSLEDLSSQLTHNKFMKFFDISGNYALFKINDYSSNNSHTLKNHSSDELFYFRRAFFDVLVNGTSNDNFDGNELNYSDDERNIYTLYALSNNLNSILSKAGLEIKKFEITDTDLNQVDITTFSMMMNISISVSDRLSTISINRTFHLEKNFSIEGFPDPMIKRESQKIPSLSMNIEKQIYTNNTPLELDIKNINVGKQGQGFFYGELVNANDSATNSLIGKRHYILVGTYNDTIKVSDYSQFGAYILTNEPVMNTTTSPPSETETFMAITYNLSGDMEIKNQLTENQAFAVVPNFDILKFNGPENKHYALIIAKYSGKEVKSNVSKKNYSISIYDIEGLRDATICTYYLNSSRAPSYVQRLSGNALSLSSTNFGMESFLVGEWTGGKNLIEYENYSRVDWEFFNKTMGIKIRGMPGCKTFEMCSIDVGTDAPLGHFRLSDNSLTIYNLVNIACNDGRARCDK
ncbi:MAG: hypothetical protein AB1391_02930 [Candidatus Micrarchaeota archaeon]